MGTRSTIGKTMVAATFLLAGLARADDAAFIGRYDLRGRTSTGVETRVLVDIRADGPDLVIHRTTWHGRQTPRSWTSHDVRRDGAALCATFPISAGMAGRLGGAPAEVLTARYAVQGTRMLETTQSPASWRSRWTKATGRRLGDAEVPMRGDNISIAGPATERYDIVFVADGYEAHELPAFRRQVAAAVNRLRATEPFTSYWGYMNMYVVDVVSPRSGLRAARGPLGTLAKDPEDTPDIDRERAMKAARLGTDAPEAVVIVANETFRSCAFRGINVCSALDPEFAETVVHELGHTVGLLLDEYEENPSNRWDFVVANEWTQGYMTWSGWGANITVRRGRDTIPWRRWLTPGAPLPTPRGSGVAVGMYQGGNHESKAFYRPSESCLMGADMLQPFCPVCREAIVLRLSKATFPLRLESQQLDKDTWRITVKHEIPGRPRFRWTRNGFPVGDGSNVFVARRSESPWGEGDLVVEVEDTTDWVRADDNDWTTFAATWVLDKGYAWDKGLRIRGPWRYQSQEPGGEDVSAHLERLFAE